MSGVPRSIRFDCSEHVRRGDGGDRLRYEVRPLCLIVRPLWNLIKNTARIRRHVANSNSGGVGVTEGPCRWRIDV